MLHGDHLHSDSVTDAHPTELPAEELAHETTLVQVAEAEGVASVAATAASDEWEQLGNMRFGRGEHANAVVNGKIYVFGGIVNPTDGVRQVERFDPATGRWSVVGWMPETRHHYMAGSTVYGTEVWLVGGKSGNDTTGSRRVDVFNTATSQWRRAPDLPGVHWGGPSVIIGDELHVFMGATGTHQTTNHHWVLNLKNQSAGWQEAPKVPTPRVHAGAVALNGKIYLIGGEMHHSHDQDTRTVFTYDPVTKTYDYQAANLPMARSHLEWATFVYDGKIISVSGVDSSKSPRGQSEIYQYDPATNRWSLLAQLPFKAVSPGAKVVNDTLYVFGGGVNDWFGGSMNRTFALPLIPDGNSGGGGQGAAPTVANQFFSVMENSSAHTTVGEIQFQKGSANRVNFTIVGGVGQGVFYVDDDGRIRVAEGASLDYESEAWYSIDVRIADASNPSRASVAEMQIQIRDQFEIISPESPVIKSQSFSIAEDAGTQDVVGSLNYEPGSVTIPRFSITGGSGQSVFYINTLTGRIQLKSNAQLDYESTSSYTLQVRVQDAVLSNLSDEATITVRVTDVEEHTHNPVVEPEILSEGFTVPHGATTGFIVGTIDAVANDAGDLRYLELGGTGVDRFVVEATTGRIKVAANTTLNYNRTPSLTLGVRVRDSIDPELDTYRLLTIDVEPPVVNEKPVAPTLGDIVFSVAEDASGGVNLGRVEVEDAGTAERISYRIVGGDSSFFTIDANTGTLRLVSGAKLDYETVPELSVAVQAVNVDSPELYDTTVVKVRVQDVVEHVAPTLADQSFTIREDAASGALVGKLAFDSGTSQQLQFVVEGGSGASTFNVDSTSGTIRLNANKTLDYETTSSYVVSVRLRDASNPGLSDLANVTIRVADVNEEPDKVAPSVDSQTFSIAENSAAGAVVGTVSADPGTVTNPRYRIIGGTGLSKFTIDSATGQIRVDGALDFESQSTYTLNVFVDDPLDSTLSDSALMSINVTDVSEQPTEVAPSINDQQFTVPENSPAGTVVGFVAYEKGTANDVQLAILGGTGSTRFRIDNGGRIRVSVGADLDFESRSGYLLDVAIYEVGNPSMTDVARITIDLTDVAEIVDVAPTLPNQSFTVEEDAVPGSSIGSLGFDPGTADRVVFDIVGGNGRGVFSVHASTGLLSLAHDATLDFDVENDYTLNVRVRNADNLSLGDTAIVHISVRDVVKGTTMPSIPFQTFTVLENAPVISDVGTLVANLGDAQSLRYSIVGGTGRGAFYVVSLNGRIKVADSTWIDYERNRSFTLEIRARDSADASLITYQTIRIDVINLPDTNEETPQPPVLSNQSFSISEDAESGDSVGFVAVESRGDATTLDYAVVGGTGRNVFAIDSTTGRIGLAAGAKLDYETNKTYSLAVRVTSASHPDLFDTAEITINVTDVVETIPSVPPTVANQSFSVNNDAAPGRILGKLEVQDMGTADRLSFELLGNHAGLFRVMPDSGALSVSGSADLSKLQSGVHQLQIRVSDAEDSTSNVVAQVTISIEDVLGNDGGGQKGDPPSIEDQAFSVPENSPGGRTLGVVKAQIPGLQDGEDIVFSIVEGDAFGVIGIEADTGRLFVEENAGIDFEMDASYEFYVRAARADSPQSYKEARIRIIVLDDESDNGGGQVVRDPVKVVLEDQFFSVFANTEVGRSVGQVLAQNLPSDAQFRIVGGARSNFSIDRATGKIAFEGWEGLPQNETFVSLEVQLTSASADLDITATMRFQIRDSVVI